MLNVFEWSNKHLDKAIIKLINTLKKVVRFPGGSCKDDAAIFKPPMWFWIFGTTEKVDGVEDGKILDT